MHGLRLLSFALCTLLLTHSAAHAQTGSIGGRVVDPQGGVVIGAAVTLTPVAGNARTTRTAPDGTFGFEGLPPGDYTLQVEAPGFATSRQRVTVAAGRRTIDVALQVAGLVEDVSVIGTAATTLSRPTLTASRLGLSLLELPASVQIISGDRIRERGDTTLADAKSRAVGVVSQANPGNGGGAVSARGFGGVGSVMQLFDGDQLFVGAGTVTFPFDPWTVDRIEVLGGPSSVLYGTGAIGGVVNVIPRKPNTAFRENEIRIAAGSFDTLRAAIDSAGPINDRTAYRFDLSHNRSDGWIERADSDSTALSASLRYQVTPTLALTLSEDFGHQNPETYFGTPSVGGRVDESIRKINYNVADADIWYRDSWTQGRVEWTPSQDFRLRSTVQILDTDRHWRNVENYTIDPAAQTVFREFYLEIFHRQRQYGNRTDALIDGRVFGRPNTLTVGFDYNFVRFQHENNSPYGGSSVVDLRRPDPGLFINLAGTTPRFRTRTHRVAAFVEDRIVVSPKVSLVGGFRADRYDVTRLDLVTNGTAERVYTPTAWRGGVVYSVRPTLSIYGQYSTATDVIGNVISNTPARLLLDPNTGRQVEGGVKQTFWQQRGEWTVAGYYIVKTNLLAPDPNNPGTQLQIGQQSSRGVEATFALALPQGVRVDANVAVLDARFDEFAQNVGGVLVSRIGNTPPNIPERTANLWVTWDAPQDWQFRGGVRYVGDRFWNFANSGTVPGYTVLDAGVRRRLARNVAVDLRLYNLTDALYATTYYDSTQPQWLLGRPRSAEIAVIVGF